jgi:signal peptidase II
MSLVLARLEIMRKLLLKSGVRFVWIALIVILADRVTKMWALEHLSLSESLRILPIFNLTLAYNTGAAFSLLHQASGWQNIFLCTLAVIVSMAIVYKLATTPSNERWMGVALGLILGGALGNAWDRIQFSYVIDFLHFHLADWHFAIFNVADSAICVGAFMLLGYWLLYKKE